METKRLIDDNESINSDDANLNDYLFRFQNNRRFEDEDKDRTSKTNYLFNMIFNKIINRKTTINGHNSNNVENNDSEQESSPTTATETTAMNTKTGNNNNSKKGNNNNKMLFNNRYK